MTMLFWLAAFWPTTILLAGAAATQERCGEMEIRIEVGVGEQLCVKPGSAQPFKDCPHCPEMIVVPAGTFTMGSPANEERHHGAAEGEEQVQVTIAKPFAVGRFSVTRGEFAAFVAATNYQIDAGCFVLTESGYKRDPERSWRSPGFAQNDRHPAVCISWDDAKAYIAWLSSVIGRSYRLLSEAEREYVTRAGSTTPFWWGVTISTDQANYSGHVTYGAGARSEWRRSTVPVDSFAANPWGLYNVHGNVWDWTEDCWNQYNAGNPGNGMPRVTGDCSMRVKRGGSWHNYPHTIRSARRMMDRPSNREDFVGFRVARTL